MQRALQIVQRWYTANQSIHLHKTKGAANAEPGKTYEYHQALREVIGTNIRYQTHAENTIAKAI